MQKMTPDKPGRWLFKTSRKTVIYWVEQVGFDVERGPLFEIVGSDTPWSDSPPKVEDYDLDLKDAKSGKPLGEWIKRVGDLY